MDLSILIPSRNEEWLSETLEDLLKNIRGNTEIIVVLDGAPEVKPLPVDPRITVIRYQQSIGQRAATNAACRLSRAKYVMKVDAHCAFDEGFDVKLMADMQDDWTVVPVMRNLHIFDWVCKNGHRRYQSPSGPCTICNEPTEKDVVWIPKLKPESYSYRFDTTLHFQYFREYKNNPKYREQHKSLLTETMSLQGSSFMLTRDKYWELNICDEEFGSWGAQGTEVACKTWLSGGKCIVNHKTWYGHLFRTQGGDFSFPYKQDNAQVERARELSRRLFLDNTWPLQKYPLSWLVDRFAPVPGWHDGTDNGMLARIREWGTKMLE
jgi:glycosyltransferase involved in cell wall biosynthesis